MPGNFNVQKARLLGIFGKQCVLINCCKYKIYLGDSLNPFTKKICSKLGSHRSKSNLNGIYLVNA